MTIVDKRKGKLTHGEQKFVLQALAEDHSCGQVIELLKETFGKELHRSTIFCYSRRYANEIEEIRKKINASLESVPITSKLIRQRRREFIYQKYISEKKYSEALRILDDVDRMEAPAPANNPPGIQIGISNTTNNTHVISQLSDQEIDECMRTILEKRQAVTH